jgi:phosphoserine phosphatase RsbU/P
MFKILIIDDDPIIQLILRKTLEDQGYEVILSNSGEAGLDQVKQHQPALVICDWLMPGINGLEVCQQLKAEPILAKIFFILLSSRTEVRDRVKGLDAGADDILGKPIEVGELLARVRAGLRLYQAAQELQMLAQDLQTQKQHLEAELAEAGDYVRSLLPAALTGAISSEALFVPSKQLGGDCFDYYWLDPDYLMIYLLDVSGHGLGAALMSVTLQNLIRTQSLHNVNFYRPEDVLRGLNKEFQMSTQNPRYFSLWYGIYNRAQNRLTYASAGHPPAVLISGPELDSNPGSNLGPDSGFDRRSAQLQVQTLRTRGAPIGMMPDTKYSSAHCQLDLPSRLFVFSDGGYEIRQANGQLWSIEPFIQLLTRHACTDQPLERVLTQIQAVAGSDSFEDDFSLLQVTICR